MKFDILTQTKLFYKLRELEIPYITKSDTVGVEVIINENELENDFEATDENGEQISIGKFDFVFGQGFKLNKKGEYTKHFPRLTLK